MALKWESLQVMNDNHRVYAPAKLEVRGWRKKRAEGEKERERERERERGEGGNERKRRQDTERSIGKSNVSFKSLYDTVPPTNKKQYIITP